MASRALTDLHPALQPLARQHIDLCAAQGVHILIYCTWRSRDEQARLYVQGRTRPGKIVTWARPGESLHNHTMPDGTPAALAYDCVPLINGKPVWVSTHPVWATVGAVAKQIGLEWAGTWSRKKREFPHFQINRPA